MFKNILVAWDGSEHAKRAPVLVPRRRRSVAGGCSAENLTLDRDEQG
jgi:hypothetical protein